MRSIHIYCDESEDHGRYYGNFYGGALVLNENLAEVEDKLKKRVNDLGLTGEIKWSKTTTLNFQKYIDLMDLFFDLIEEGKIKVRIMFTQNAHEGINLTPEQRRNEFFILYYHFIKHAFGLKYCNPSGEPIRLKILFDELPKNLENRVKFKQCILALQGQDDFRRANISMQANDLEEVDSKRHVILQCLDVVLGGMNFRLNELHLEKPKGSRRRGKKTIVKEKLYKHINGRLQRIRPYFNIGESTGHDNDQANRWRHSYRHWKFVPSESQYHEERTKGYNKK